MATAIPNLWSDDIRVDILTPLAILRSQADLLRQLTKGILQAEVTVGKDGDENLHLQFDLIVPALNHYRHRLLVATHTEHMVYPVLVEAECFANRETFNAYSGGASSDHLRRACTESEFLELVGAVFQSAEVRSILQSLIARSNDEKTANPSPPPQGSG